MEIKRIFNKIMGGQNLLNPDTIINFIEIYELLVFKLLGIRKDYEF